MRAFIITILFILLINPAFALEYDVKPIDTFVEEFRAKIYSNLDFKSKDPSYEATVAFNLSPEGKITGFKILSTGGKEFDKALLKAFSAVNNKSDMEGYWLNRNMYFVGKFNADSTYKQKNPLSKKVYAYSKEVTKDIQQIGSSLPKWHSFKIKPVIVWIELSKGGRAFDVKLVQSSGVSELDKAFVERIRTHQFQIPPKELKDSDLRFVVNAYQLDDNLKITYKEYLRHIGDKLFQCSPYSRQNTVLLRMTIEKSGHLKPPKLMSMAEPPVYRAILASRFGQVELPAFPGEIDLDDITFTYEFTKSPNRLKRNVRWYKVRTLPNYIVF